MKPKKNLCLKVMSLVMACVLSLQFATSAFANQSNWNLAYDPKRPSSENLTSWTEQVHATKATTKFKLTVISGGANIQAQSTNGINSTYTSPGTARTSASIGAPITITVKYIYTGGSKNRPSGIWTY